MSARSVIDDKEQSYLMSGLDLWLIMLSNDDRRFCTLLIPTFVETNFAELKVRGGGFMILIQQVLLQMLTLDGVGNRHAIEWLQHLLNHCTQNFSPPRMTIAMHLKSHWLMDGSDPENIFEIQLAKILDRHALPEVARARHSR